MAINVTHTKVVFPTPDHKKRQRLERDIAGLQAEYDSSIKASKEQLEAANNVKPKLDEFKAELEAMGDLGIDQPDETDQQN